MQLPEIRIKRYIRQVFHEFDGQLHNDADYVIIARKPTAEMDYFRSSKKSVTCFTTCESIKETAIRGQEGRSKLEISMMRNILDF